MAHFTFEAIGTTWRIDTFRDVPRSGNDELLSKIRNRIDVFDKAYSRFRQDSPVTRMSKEAGTYELPSDAGPMMALYRDMYEKTGGLVTPLVGDLISAAGYDAHYSLKEQGRLKSPPTWEEALEYTPPNLNLKKPVLLDFGAAGKGYLVDLVAEVIESAGVAEYCVDAGGDIRYKGETPLRVGLEDPADDKKVVGVCTLSGGSICGSAGNRRKWGRFTHIMNPQTLSSPTDILAVWVTANTALIADGLTTCLFFVPPTVLADAYQFEYVIVRNDRSVEVSPGFSGEIFTDVV